MSARLSKRDAERFAKIYLEDLVVSSLLRSGRALRTVELVSAIADGLQVSRALLRMDLGESERVRMEERRWDLASRMESRNRPLEGLVDYTLRLCGKPLSLSLLTREVANVRGEHLDYLRSVINRLVSNNFKYVRLGSDLFALDEWLLDAGAENEEDVILENFLDREEDMKALLSEVNPRDLTRSGAAEDWCAKIVGALGRPIAHKVLSFLVWKGHPQEFDPVMMLKTIVESKQLSLLCGGYVCDGGMLAELKREVTRRSGRAEREAGEGAVITDLEDLLRRQVPKERAVRLRPEEIEEIKKFMRTTQSPVSLALVMQDIFELSPEDRTFVPTLHALNEELRNDRDFTPVGKERWFLRDLISPEIHQVPDPLLPIHLDLRTMEDEVIDVILRDEGLDANLSDLVRASDWEDIGEENEVERVPKNKMSGDTLTYTPLYHHFKCGTMKLRAMDEEFFPPGVSMARVVFVDEDYGEVPVWCNRETGLIYGLRDWYDKRVEVVGNSFTLERTESAERFAVSSVGAPHPQAAIEPGRLRELLSYAEKVENTAKPMLEILHELMQDHQSGVDFITLWSEINVIRRTSKRLIASLLSGYHCFYARQRARAWIWRFDVQRIDQGFMRQKRKFVRR